MIHKLIKQLFQGFKSKRQLRQENETLRRRLDSLLECCGGGVYFNGSTYECIRTINLTESRYEKELLTANILTTDRCIPSGIVRQRLKRQLLDEMEPYITYDYIRRHDGHAYVAQIIVLNKTRKQGFLQWSSHE